MHCFYCENSMFCVCTECLNIAIHPITSINSKPWLIRLDPGSNYSLQPPPCSEREVRGF